MPCLRTLLDVFTPMWVFSGDYACLHILIPSQDSFGYPELSRSVETPGCWNCRGNWRRKDCKFLNFRADKLNHPFPGHRFFQDQEPEWDFRRHSTTEYIALCACGTKSDINGFILPKPLGYKVHSRWSLLVCLSNDKTPHVHFLLFFLSEYLTSIIIAIISTFESNMKTNLNQIHVQFILLSSIHSSKKKQKQNYTLGSLDISRRKGRSF